ncbi:MAG: OmpA family protein [Chitinophagaceae bacterium]
MKNQAVKKTSLLCVAVFLLCQYAAQSQIRLFLTGGPQIGTIESSGTDAVYGTDIQPFMKGRTSARIGVQADIPFKPNSRWALQPGIFFSGKGSLFQKEYDTTGANASPFYYRQTTNKNDYIDIPVQLAYKLPLSKKASFFLSAGPMVSVFYASETVDEFSYYTPPVDPDDFGRTEIRTEETKGETGTDPGKFKSAYFGVSGSAGFDFGPVMLSGFFTRGLSGFDQPAVPGNFYHQTIGGSLSIRIARQKEAVSQKPPAVPPSPKPMDRDNDGVPDAEDNCPDEPGSKATNGCPDRDGDGVPDKDDLCPDVKGLVKYKGCPVPDTDKDGINDEDDACPTVPGVARFKGCPIPDRDNDGVNDEEDLCPDQPGSQANKGCPAVKEESLKKVADIAASIQFAFGKTTIDPKYHATLNEIASMLEGDLQLKLSVEGHTDNKGSAERNRLVSQQRADAIRNYLISKGAPAKNVTATGFGPDQPVAGNETEAGRAKNRRVVFKLSY